MQDVHRWALCFLISALQDIECKALPRIPGGRGRKEIFHAPYGSRRIMTQEESLTDFREHGGCFIVLFTAGKRAKVYQKGRKKTSGLNGTQ